MSKKIIPIKTLIKKIEKLSSDPKHNKVLLNKYSDLVESQSELMDKVSIENISRELDNCSSISEISNYKMLLQEKKNYDKYSSTIDDIIDRNYRSINNNRKIRNTKISVALGTGALVTILGMVSYNSLSKSHKNIEEETINTTEISTEVLYSTYSTTRITTLTTTETTTESNNTTEYNIDEDIVDYDKFNDIKDFYDDANKYIDTMENTLADEEERNKAKENAKKSAIKYIDFIFYGSEINGVTFDELKDDEKAKVYKQLQLLDEKIREKDPDYLDNLNERYKRLRDLGSLTLDKAKEKIKEKVGEDYYNDAEQVKNDVVDTVKETGSLIKKFIKDKYEDWREDN